MEPTPAPDPSAPRTDLEVGFAVLPEVGEAPPVLRVVLRNLSAAPIAMVRFPEARCFAHFYMKLRISGLRGPVTLTPCAGEDGPGSEFNLAANGEERVLLPLAELAPKWPRGTYEIEVEWDPSGLDQARGTTSARARQTSLNTSKFAIVPALVTVRVERGETVALPGGARLTFAGHSHKRVMAGDSSPLMIYGTIAGRGKPEAFSLNLHTELTRLIRIGDDQVFELVDYAYDEWMVLRYYGEVPL